MDGSSAADEPNASTGQTSSSNAGYPGDFQKVNLKLTEKVNLKLSEQSQTSALECPPGRSRSNSDEQVILKLTEKVNLKLSEQSQTSALEQVPRRSRSRSNDGVDLWLHVYDLDSTSAHLNNLGLRSASFGLFHCGVEVLGEEYHFGWGESTLSGIRVSRPKQHSVHSYRESIYMGQSPLTAFEIDKLIQETCDSWPEIEYNPIRNNCTRFAEEFLSLLKSPESFPQWVHGAAAYGKADFLRPLVDWSWDWAKWMARGS